MEQRTKIAIVGIAMFAFGSFASSHAPNFAGAAGGTEKIYACKNLTTLVPRIVSSPSSCTILESAVEWRVGPEEGTEFPYICNSCNLNGVNVFAGRNLTEAWLKGNYINNVSFVGTNLTGATMSGGSYTESDFSGANLTNVDFSDSNLTGATNMASATRTGITWSNTVCPDGTNSEMNGLTCEGHLTP
jgi:uncharacterized protein YjbI with pentapeptide repeats